jgi:outer membrane protein assembly factor BamE (lipoprotein component of BamABCDE complex)
MDMKRLFLTGAFLIGLSACASLNQEVFENLHEGDGSDKVVELLGEPQQFGPSQVMDGAQAWYYVRHEEMCGFTIKDKMIARIVCMGNHVSGTQRTLNAVGGAASGFSEGFGDSSKKATQCVSNRDTATGSYFTNCR